MRYRVELKIDSRTSGVITVHADEAHVGLDGSLQLTDDAGRLRRAFAAGAWVQAWRMDRDETEGA